MKIDWMSGYWFVWDIKTGSRLAKVRQIHIQVPSKLHNETNAEGVWRGYLIVSGQLRVDGEIGFIE